MNGMIFMSATEWKPKNVIFFKKNCSMLRYALVFHS